MKEKTPFESYFGHKPDVSNFKVFVSTTWDRIPLDKRKYLQPQIIECLFIGYIEESKGFKLLNIRTKWIFIERSVCFEEPLQEVELVEENIVEIPSCSTDHLDNENGSEGSDIADLMSDISEKHISDSESDYDVSTHLPTWAKKTLSFFRTNIENPVDPRRT